MGLTPTRSRKPFATSPFQAGQSRMGEKKTARSKLTSPWWGGRPSERVCAKKAGWGVRSFQCFVALNSARRLDRSPHPARLCAEAQEARRPPHKGEVVWSVAQL